MKVYSSLWEAVLEINARFPGKNRFQHPFMKMSPKAISARRLHDRVLVSVCKAAVRGLETKTPLFMPKPEP